MITFQEWLDQTEYYPQSLTAYKAWLGDRINYSRYVLEWDQLYFDYVEWLAYRAGQMG